MGPSRFKAPRRTARDRGLSPLLACALLGALAAATPAGLAGSGPDRATTAGEIDAFMARVLEQRARTWRTLHDYVLDERERLEILGPGSLALYGMTREFTWYVRDGYLIRSPVRHDGVAVPEPDRRRFEERWLRQEQEREERRLKRLAEGPPAPDAPTPDTRGTIEQPPDLEGFVRTRGEPRFVSEAYFLDFKLDPGNYYFAGRETLDGRDVVRVEYYPVRFFSGDKGGKDDSPDEAREAAPANATDTKAPATRRHREQEREQEHEKELEDRIERGMDKVVLVTLWVDPAQHQIVKYTLDNADFGFLPLAGLARVDEAKATMTMGEVFPGVWLPQRLSAVGRVTLAPGTLTARYTRDFRDYRRAETSARIRHYDVKE